MYVITYVLYFHFITLYFYALSKNVCTCLLCIIY